MSNTARRQSVTYPNGRVVNLGYGSTGSVDDLFSLVKSAAISGESGNKVEYTRAGLGRFVKIAYPQPAVEMSMIRPGGGSVGDSGDPYDGYDRFGRVQEIRWQNSSTGTPIDAWQWGYNEASSRTWKKNLVAASGQDEAYGYDGLYQVIRDAVGTLNTNRTAIGGVPGEEEDFTYDPTGNWLGYRKDTNGSVVLDQSRSNNQDNQLTQIDGSSALLSYDRVGNATKTTPGTNGDWSKSYQPVWDAWNRLVEVKDETGSSLQKNAYDGLSRRITKESGSTVTHTYWSDRWKPLEERIGSATGAARSYLWGERPGHRDELVLRDRDTDGNGTLDERLYATMDYFNGTAVLNTSGSVQERYAYSAFGVRRIMRGDFTPRSTSNYAWDFGFQGQFRDNETGWSNYGYRFYVPLLGRWINRDPIGEDGGYNVYGFVGNSGIDNVDILGLQKLPEGWNEGEYPESFDPANLPVYDPNSPYRHNYNPIEWPEETSDGYLDANEGEDKCCSCVQKHGQGGVDKKGGASTMRPQGDDGKWPPVGFPGPVKCKVGSQKQVRYPGECAPKAGYIEADCEGKMCYFVVTYTCHPDGRRGMRWAGGGKTPTKCQ
jgi:RHS repeat-associated protein